MVNAGLVEAILREQNDPGTSTTRQIRELYNNRSGENAIVQNTDIDKEFQSILLKALETYTGGDDEEKPISYTVKLKDGDENTTPSMKRRSIIKLSKENKSESESDDASSDSEKIQTASSITISKPFSPLFLNNMKKFGVSTDWLAKRSNSARHSSYSRSSIKSNASQLDAMIKSASAKPIKSSRKLSFVESANTKPVKLELDKENVDPTQENTESKEEVKENSKSTAYDLSSESEEENSSNGFSLRIERVDLISEKKQRSASSSSASDDEKSSKPKELSKPKRKSKKSEQTNDNEKSTADQDTNSSQKKDKTERVRGRIEQLKKLLRTAGIRPMIRNAELEEYSSEKAKIKYLKSLFEKAAFTGNFNLKDCEKFRKKREEEKELSEIQANSVTVKGHIKGGRTLRGRARSPDEIEFPVTKRKRKLSEDTHENGSSSDVETPTVKKRRIPKMEVSPEVSEDEIE